MVIWAGYAQFDSQITGKFSLSAGFRYDHYNYGFGGSTNPRLAADLSRNEFNDGQTSLRQRLPGSRAV